MKQSISLLLFIGCLFLIFSIKQWSIREKMFKVAALKKSEIDPKIGDLKLHLLGQKVEELESLSKQCNVYFAKTKTPIAKANVIFYPPHNKTFCTIDLGEKNCPFLKKKSMVCFGSMVVGVVDRVMKTTSIVRLLTNPQLNLSVRLERGSIQTQFAKDLIDQLIANPIILPKEKQQLLEISQQLQQKKRHHHLAKGTMQGMKDNKLIGVGFQYDFADDYGPSRNLMTYKPVQTSLSLEAPPLLEIGDLIVTTGYDGTFIEGLLVGIVAEFEKDKNDIAYNIESYPLIDFENLKTVLVLPPIYEED
jgi:hypothetical protein